MGRYTLELCKGRAGPARPEARPGPSLGPGRAGPGKLGIGPGRAGPTYFSRPEFRALSADSKVDY